MGTDQILEALGGAETLIRDGKQFAKDSEFVRQHFQKLIERYPDHWVAVFMGQAVGADKDLEVLIGKLKVEGFPVSRVVMEFVTERKVARVL